MNGYTIYAKQLDLRTHACMPAMKNQNPCGNCYAFGATNPIEYQLCRKNGALTILRYVYIQLYFKNTHYIFLNFYATLL